MVELLYCTPETKIALYINYTSVKKERRRGERELYYVVLQVIIRVNSL